jgi:hypothetical protein
MAAGCRILRKERYPILSSRDNLGRIILPAGNSAEITIPYLIACHQTLDSSSQYSASLHRDAGVGQIMGYACDKKPKTHYEKRAVKDAKRKGKEHIPPSHVLIGGVCSDVQREQSY